MDLEAFSPRDWTLAAAVVLAGLLGPPAWAYVAREKRVLPWVALGVALGVAGTVAWHVACPSCQARALAWRRALGLRLVE